MSDKLTPVLMRAAVFFTVMLILGIIAVSVSHAYMNNVYQDEQAAQRDMRFWQGEIHRSVEKNQIIDEFESDFLKLVAQGVVGSEDRLGWFETLQRAAKKRGMSFVKYSISEQKLLQKDNLTRQHSDINVYKSVMTLDMKMAHEGDLFALLNDLRKANGLFAVHSCNLEKISKEIVYNKDNMKAYCKIGWYTFKSVKANSGSNNSG